MGLNILQAAYTHFSKSGITYEYGGRGADSNGNGKPEVDCSYLVGWALENAGYNISAEKMSTSKLFTGDSVTSFAQQNFEVFDKNTTITSGTLQPGDLILFKANSGNMQHIGIFTGYDENGNIKFYGSQTTTGPAETIISSSYWNNVSSSKGFHIVGALRPKETEG